MALLALLVLPTIMFAAGLGRVVRQANFQEKAGCLHDVERDAKCWDPATMGILQSCRSASHTPER